MWSSRNIFTLALALILLLAGVAQADMATEHINNQDAHRQLLSFWGEEQITSSRIMNKEYSAAKAPMWDADPMNITLVVETGGRYITVLNGDTYEQLDRFPTRFAALADLKFSPDGHYAYIVSHSGWVEKYDIWSLKSAGRVKAGLGAINIAISADGKWLAVANYLPKTLVILSADDLSLGAVIATKGDDGAPSAMSTVQTNPLRESFILALSEAPKIWEVFYGPNPPAFGFAHDWRIEGPVPQSTPFPIRKITTPTPLDDFTFDPSYEYVLGAGQQGGGMVIDLVIGQKVADLDLPGRLHFGAGISWKRGDASVMAIPHLDVAFVSVVDMKTWETVERIPTQGASQFVRSVENSKHLWVGVFEAPDMNAIQIIDKQTLATIRTLGPMSVVDVEFTKDANHALVTVREDGGAVIVYDAETLTEVTRLPMRNPSGIYNIRNRITYWKNTNQ